jgi:hypothetical protein
MIRLLRLPRLRPGDRVAFYLGWKTASRWDDIAQLRGAAVLSWTVESVVLYWGAYTKTSQSGRHLHEPHLLTVVVRATSGWDAQEFEFARVLLAALTEQASVLLQSVDPRLSGHSLKRGAITHLIRAGAPLELISRLAKHAVVSPFSATTLSYAGDAPSLAWALRTQEVTSLL